MTLQELDPFDLPEWVATSDVVWRPEGSLGRTHLVRGELETDTGPTLACDVFAVDQAYPQPVADGSLRTRAHREWHHAQVLCIEMDGRLTLAVPGISPGVQEVLVALSRLALAVGAPVDHISALLSLGDTEQGQASR